MNDTLSKAFRLLAVAYPRWAATFTDPDMVDTWSEMLADVSERELLPAVRTLCLRSKWPPSVAEIREAAGVKQPKAPSEGDRIDREYRAALDGEFGAEAKRVAAAAANPVQYWTQWNAIRDERRGR